MAETTSGINQIPKPGGGFIYTATKVIQDGVGKVCRHKSLSIAMGKKQAEK